MISRALAVGLPLFAVALVLSISVDASRRRAARSTTALRTVGRVLPAPDLAISPGARHLRHPSTEEPWAAFSDGPTERDSEPSGGMIAAPAGAYLDHANRTRR